MSIDMDGSDFKGDTTHKVADILANVQEELETGATQNAIRDSAGRQIGGWFIHEPSQARKCA